MKDSISDYATTVSVEPVENFRLFWFMIEKAYEYELGLFLNNFTSNKRQDYAGFKNRVITYTSSS